MPRFYETTLSITNLHNLSISTHVNCSRMLFLWILFYIETMVSLLTFLSAIMLMKESKEVL